MENNLWECRTGCTGWGRPGGARLHLDAAIDFYTSETAFSGIDKEKVSAVIADHPTDVYLLSPMTPNPPYSYEIADVIKEIHPRSLVVMGGVVATPLHREVAAHPSVDYVVYDRGEYALPDLLAVVESGGDILKVGNLSYRGADGTVVTNQRRYPYTLIEDIPFPKTDLFPTSGTMPNGPSAACC